LAWQVRAIRGAITAEANTEIAIATAVHELLDGIQAHNSLDLSAIVNVIFSVTTDLDVVFPAQIARSRPGWQDIPLLDLQQMHVVGSLPRCIRVLIQVNQPINSHQIQHIYLGEARHLRPDLEVTKKPTAETEC
jgi:chorismate mutase